MIRSERAAPELPLVADDCRSLPKVAAIGGIRRRHSGALVADMAGIARCDVGWKATGIADLAGIATLALRDGRNGRLRDGRSSQESDRHCRSCRNRDCRGHVAEMAGMLHRAYLARQEWPKWPESGLRDRHRRDQARDIAEMAGKRLPATSGTTQASRLHGHGPLASVPRRA
jgi:hypothetical protein